MPFMHESSEALTYIDPPPTSTSLAQIDALIAAELASTDTNTLHPSIPTLTSPSFTSLQSQHERLAAGETLSSSRPAGTGIDTSLFDLLDIPDEFEEPAQPLSTEEESQELSSRKTAFLNQTTDYTLRAAPLHTYLLTRQTTLSLLSTPPFGKNPWLVANHALEAQVKATEAAVSEMKRETEEVERRRRELQEEARPELEELEGAWRRGVRRGVEVEVAAEGVRGEILGMRRRGAV
ncbi:hypothetical protein K402DRAFT_466594 [Aulographum hederae CBS 113979]|uniref:Breast carcinoma amplified sequence 2 n=1 Tax=Aulographum hederae CBS 113979 TaxID=1176131 RepID=A0A6G1GP76_9PEZI|nr:hypothetical protein K402DRAFT_466594 [Aulographum hederae CBS 113979]